MLLADDPGIQRLTDLPRGRRMAFLADLDRLGEALERVCGQLDPAFRRVNLEILGIPVQHRPVRPAHQPHEVAFGAAAVNW